ncbi:class I SAM-dependent methyltransferase [Salegentibacter sp. BDJ18]|uniref:class I SAM-dependent methyltransferase n=1 Tax=Salegentibacter sp. BDJ18 TaxID=2816376 RepID=UPI001AAF80D1|nr:class I SAM-dependent methyltransferase [Salegentibacter sp. BDJ18]MBO2544284.1 class I SAM-dependent methyltransferase [Salegentibacter sp. BDJ18]
MTRTELLQQLIDKNRYKSYLEIGTFQGKSFLPLKINKKVAIDPSFKIKKKEKIKWLLKYPFNLQNRYYEMTSNDFFEIEILKKKKSYQFDLIFIDGLHTFEASLTDTLNSLKLLNKQGTIVLHDCFPPHKAASVPANSYEEAKKMKLNGWTNEWCGDVWKTIVYLKSYHSNALSIKVLNDDYGLGIIEIKNQIFVPHSIDPDNFKAINSLNYEDLTNNPEKLISLVDN